MAIPRKLDYCPKGGCTSRSVWEDVDTGKLFSLRSDNNQTTPQYNFVPHVCTSKSAEIPTIVYAGHWRNTRTGYTRFIGPSRMEKSAVVPPKDEKNKAEWELLQLHRGEIKWEPVEVNPLLRDSVKMAPKESSDEA